MSDPLLIAVLTAAANGLVTWGVVSTKLAWMRRDIDELRERMRSIEVLA